MFRGKVASIAAFACIVTAAQCHAQAVAITSSKKHVELCKGSMLTLRTVAFNGPSGGGLVVPPDRVLETTLDQAVGGKKAHVSDSVRLTLVYPVTFEVDGKAVRIPENAAITAHVAYASARDAEHLSRLVIVADSIQWGDSRALMPAVVTSAQVPLRKTVRPPEDYHDRSVQPQNSLAVIQRGHRAKGSY